MSTTATPAPPASETDELARKRAEAEANGAAHESEKPGEGELEGEGDGEKPTVPPLELEGLGKQLSLKIKGGDPDVAEAKLQGGSIAIPAGEYNPGDVIEAVVRLRCTEVTIADNTNHSTGEVNERKRRHKFKLLSIERTSR